MVDGIFSLNVWCCNGLVCVLCSVVSFGGMGWLLCKDGDFGLWLFFLLKVVLIDGLMDGY